MYLTKCVVWSLPRLVYFISFPLDFLKHSQFLEGLKCESQTETSEGQGVGAHSLARNTLEG